MTIKHIPGYAPHHQTDCGRADTHPKEKRDCTVRALGCAAGVSYVEAHKALEAAGRTPKRGVFLSSLIANDAIPGFAFESVLFDGPIKLSNFLRNFPDGRYLLRKSKHAFSVIEGVVHDNQKIKLGVIVTHAWKVTKVCTL